MKDKRRTTDVKAVFLGVKNDSSDRGFITGSIQIVKDPSGKYKQSQAVNLFLTVEDDLPEAGYCYTFRGKHEEFNGKPNFKASEFDVLGSLPRSRHGTPRRRSSTRQTRKSKRRG